MKKTHDEVITGGPCGGKSTLMSKASHTLRSLGDIVYIVPEAATILINAGFDPTSKTFQSEIIKYQIMQENFFRQKAEQNTNQQVVLLHDRGIFDGRAYVSDKEFIEALSAEGLSLADMHRYNGVVHLVSAAVGAPDAYTTANNAARRETLEEAAVREKETLSAWLEHGKVTVIDNIGVTFEQKMDKAIAAILDSLGRPVPIEKEKKYKCKLVNLAHHLPADIMWRKIKIEQDYLQPLGQVSGQEILDRRIRKVLYSDNSVGHFYTEKTPLGIGERIEIERVIAAKEYHRFYNEEKDETKRKVRKTRLVFIADNRYFEFDTFTEPEKDYCLLEVKPTEENSSEKLPKFLEDIVLEDVTENQSYYNTNIASQ
jgi:predicted ATPase/CYTH domain-containing protein